MCSKVLSNHFVLALVEHADDPLPQIFQGIWKGEILAEARAERDNLLKEARDTKDAIIVEAKSKSQAEADRILSSAREQITNEKNAAVAELKNQVATLSIEIAEKILRSELSSDDKQKALVNNLMKDVNLN